MPLNFTDTATPQLPGLDAETVAAPIPAATGVGQAQPVAPAPLVNVTIEKMTPVVAAGVELAKIVLAITAGAIVIFVIYLFVMDWVVGSNVHDAYQSVMTPARTGAEFLTVGRLERLAADLNDLRKDANRQLSPESVQNAQELLKLMDAIPSITSAQKTQMSECISTTLGSDASRNNKLANCLAIVESFSQAALQAAAAASDAHIASDSATKISEQRQSLHNFWIQAAQLVLLNLLLPLLTALFGYIFGTQQPQRAT